MRGFSEIYHSTVKGMLISFLHYSSIRDLWCESKAKGVTMQEWTKIAKRLSQGRNPEKEDQ